MYVCIRAVKVNMLMYVIKCVSFCYLSFTISVFIQCDTVSLAAFPPQELSRGTRDFRVVLDVF